MNLESKFRMNLYKFFVGFKKIEEKESRGRERIK